ncbi:protein of unknown function [Sterolibacterium denitrificans]|uniref:Uncharacterized protein n=1 Tax=Sterolibacterium denitrificans TaxID=157592 RepID=A0A7Z7HPR3_9PROT|nr:protein of unknown function [Sterolibacterium denitrificans]
MPEPPRPVGNFGLSPAAGNLPAARFAQQIPAMDSIFLYNRGIGRDGNQCASISVY